MGEPFGARMGIVWILEQYMLRVQGLVLRFLQTLIQTSILSSAFLPEMFDPLFTGKP